MLITNIANINRYVSCLIIVALLALQLSSAEVCSVKAGEIVMEVMNSSQEPVTIIIEKDSILDKNNWGWFHLKKCYTDLLGLETILGSDIKDEDDLKAVNAVKAAQSVVEVALARYRVESKVLIDSVIHHLFCSEDQKGFSIDKFAVLNDSPLKSRKAIGFKMPTIFDEIFKEDYRVLECPKKGDNKVLIVNALGSEAVTSDYDFDMFILDKSALKKISDKMNKSFNDSGDEHSQGSYDEDDPIKVLSQSNLLTLDRKKLYLEFVQIIMNGFDEVTQLIKNIYKGFRVIVPRIKQAEQNKSAGYMVQLGTVDKNDIMCSGLTDCFDSNAYAEVMAVNTLLLKLPLQVLTGDAADLEGSLRGSWN